MTITPAQLGSKQVIGFSLTGEIDREEWGITHNMALETGGFLVGKKVRLEIEADRED